MASCDGKGYVASCDGKGKTMGARLINNPRRTNIGHVEDFPVLHMRWLRKSAMFSEGQRTEGHFLYPGASNAITIIVDLRCRAQALAGQKCTQELRVVRRGLEESCARLAGKGWSARPNRKTSPRGS